MKGSSYRERDYAFGQLMLTLRTKLELTQTELAEVLGVRRRAVINWEESLALSHDRPSQKVRGSRHPAPGFPRRS